MNDKNKKKISSLASIKFIFDFMKSYWLGLIFVAIFILATTYFQVISPKLIGNAIDDMIGYVGTSNVEKIEEQIANGEGLTQEQKDFITADMSSEEAKTVNEATEQDLQKAYEIQELKDEVYKLDETSIMNNKGYSEEQLQYINNSDVLDEKTKAGLAQVGQSPKGTLQIKRDYILQQKGFLDKETEDSKTMTNEELDSLYNLVGYRNYVLSLDEDAIVNKTGLSQRQLDFLNTNVQYQDKKVTDDQISQIKSMSTSDLTESYQSRKKEIDSKKEHSNFLNAMILLLLSYVALAVSNLIYNILMAIIAGKTTRDMRKGLFGKIEELSIRFFDRSNDGDLLSRFTNDIDNISNAMNQSLVQVLSQLGMLIGIITMMFIEDNSSVDMALMGIEFTLHHVLVWIMLGFALLSIILASVVIRKAQYHLSRQQEKLGLLNGYIDERISGQKVIITYGLQEETIAGFKEYNDDFKKTATLGSIYSGSLMPLMQGIGLIAMGALVYFGSEYVISGVMTIGLLTAFIQYTQRFFGPLAQLVSQYNVIELGITGSSRIKEVYNEEAEVINTMDAKPIAGINGKVELKNVNFGYDENKPVLKDINIEVKKGQMIALVGPTGSGKTTVMNLMNRFYDIDSGDIKFDDISIKDITLDTLRKNVGIVLQESIIFSGTVEENIAYGKTDATLDEVIKAAKTANIHDFIMTLDEGYQTQINNNTSSFSTGQKQLMSIARTILTDPDLLILDEATSNVDTVTEARIQKAMENVLKGRTSFVIAHRLKTILNADEIIVLKDGEIIEQGNHDKLLREEGFYAELYNNQFVVEEE